MSTWRKEITNQFSHTIKSLILVNDPDYLLNDENILDLLGEKGIRVIPFEDSVAFRYLYESQLRGFLESVKLKILLYSNDEDQEVFPFDYLKKGHHVTLNINSMFPKLSPTIVKQLDPEDLDILYKVQSQYLGTNSDKETLEFILKHVFKIVHEIVDSEADLYKLLFTMHYGKGEIPLVIREFLITQLASKSGLKNLPVDELISSSQYFFHYIEKEWARFVQKLLEVTKNTVLEETELYQTHPLTNVDIRRLMDDLFLEGYLHKVKIGKQIDWPNWMRFGIVQDDEESQKDKVSSLHTKLIERLQNVSRYKDWLVISELQAEYKIAMLQTNQKTLMKDASQLLHSINQTFEAWLLQHYSSLTSLPPIPKPKMVHHIAHNLASSNKGRKDEKVALIVMDGMSFFQWKRIKEYLAHKGLGFEENGVFAWVPTLTSVSRQSIFSGQMPIMYSNHLRTTSKEESQWKMFWEDHGVLKQYVQYQKGLGREAYDKKNISAFKRPNIKVYGAVVDVIDGFVHGASQGEKSLMAELDIWLQTGYLLNLLKDLTKAKYSVYVTSDHGNTESIGIGRISEGVLVDQKGERVRVYTDKVIYDDSAKQIDSIEWNSTGLPEGYHVLLAKYGQAFVNKNERVVSHGGISLEEVIVPFIKVIPSEEE